NQFGNQDPAQDGQIEEFCQLNYGVTFQMFEKVKVNGDDAHDLFKFLRTEAKGLLGSEKIKWNFTKFLINQDGTVLKRYAPTDKPEKIAKDIEKLLA
ncbi:MAG: glutathione peroxidase, partial [Pseudomonadales bacterium]|nr:glutathione peroxidase [Pseudomonadales bacterium]